MKLSDILKKPMITERALKMVKDSVFTFYTNKFATKHQIKSAAEELFNVEVASVKTTIRKGKVRKRGKKMIKKRLPDYKIAYIKLKKGKIDLFPET